MFGIDSTELAVIALVALLVIGPKDLPKAMRWLGQWVGKGRAMSRHLRTGFDAMMRESELEEMQKVWAAQNDAIMKATALPHDALPDFSGPTPAEPAYEPWPAALPAEAQVPPPAPSTAPKRPRKPRAKKAKVVAPEGESA